MTFDEIQSIWNSQQSLEKSVDHTELQEWIRKRNQTFSRWIALGEIVSLGTLLFLAGMFAKDPILEGHDRILLLASIACLVACGFVIAGRFARKKRAVNYENSLLGIVSKSLDGVDYQISIMKNFVWFFAAPASLGLGIGWFIVDDSKRYLFNWVFIPAFAVCMALTYWQVQKEIKKNLLPEKTRLEDLKRDLEFAERS